MTRIDIPLTFAVVFLLSTLGTRLEIELLGLVVCLLVPHRDAIGLQHGEIPENEMGISIYLLYIVMQSSILIHGHNAGGKND